MIRAFFGPQMKWKRGKKSRERKKPMFGQDTWNFNLDFYDFVFS